MQDGEDLAKFIEEQRAKIAYDRGRLKNYPPSSITDNSVNRQILHLDKENRMPEDDTHAPLPPRSDNRKPLPIQTAVRPPSTPRIFRLGDDYRKKQEKLKEELRADYKHAMAEKNFHTTGRRHVNDNEIPLGARTNSDLGLSLPLKDRLSAKERMRLERNREYNQFLHHKDELDRQHREARSLSRSPVRLAPAATSVTKIFAPPSGVANLLSGEKIATGVVQPSAKDAATETYEDLLERKRKQEKSYRGIDNDDDDDIRERVRYRDAGREEDDGYYSQKRVRFPSKGRRSHGRGSRSRRDDYSDEDYDDYKYRSNRGRRRGRPARRGRRYSSEEDSEYDSEEERTPRRRRHISVERRKAAPTFEREATTGSLHTNKNRPENDDPRSKSAPPEQEFTGLPIGHVPSANTVQRRKDEYRVQLQQQMEQNKMQKKKERELDRRTEDLTFNPTTNRNNNNVKDTSPPKRRANPSPPPQDSEEPRQRKKGKKASRKFKIESSSDDEEEVSPRRGGYRGAFPRQPYFAPPYQQPTGFLPPQYPSPYDNAYYYYGTRDPLDPTTGLLPPPQPGGFPGPGVSPVMAAAFATGRAERSNTPDRSRKTGQQSQARHSYKNESSLIADEKRDQEKKKEQMTLYQEELQEQIARKEKEKRSTRMEQERYDMKMEEEARNYNPWGKGGGGAPMKDRQGNLISDLRQMHLENEEAAQDPTKAREVVKERLPQTNLYRREERPVIDLSPRNPGQADDGNMLSPRFGRSNPFESKQSNEQKAQRDVYKDFLQKQIEEKQRLEAEKRERERIEEEKEERRLEEQRKRIQAELEAEQEKDRKKRELAERQNEEIRIQAEERRKEDLRKKMDAEENDRKRKEQELDEKLRSMTKSPVIPTLRNQHLEQPQVSPRHPPPAHQPPPLQTQDETRIPTQQHPPQRQPIVHTPRIQTYRAESPQLERRPPIQSRNESKRISRELSALRKQLLSEQRRVEDQLRTVDLTQPQPRKINTEYLVDLSKAKQKPVSVRRPPTVEKDRPSSRALREFTDYKYRPDDTASIRMFKAEYPETPDDAKALERQQQALLARQTRNLNDLRHQTKSEPILTNRRERDQPRRGLIPPSVRQSKASLLEAETTYVPIIPDDDDNADHYHFDSNQSSQPQSRQSRTSARDRRRAQRPPSSTQSDRIVPPRARPDNFSLNSLSSLATLDVDRLANKNQDRLDKLRVIQGDDVSLTDPDDILDRFVNKQSKGRRPPTNDDGVGGRAGPSGYRDPDQIIASFSNRPPSVNTVDTEPWLRPETGPTVA